MSNNLLLKLESKFINQERLNLIKVGSLINIEYTTFEQKKQRNFSCEGLVIAIKNSGIKKSFIIRRKVLGADVEQIFFLHSPKIKNITIKQTNKIRRSKLYFIRNLIGKKARL